MFKLIEKISSEVNLFFFSYAMAKMIAEIDLMRKIVHMLTIKFGCHMTKATSIWDALKCRHSVNGAMFAMIVSH